MSCTSFLFFHFSDFYVEKPRKKGTRGALQFCHRQKRAYPYEIPGYRKEHVSP